MVVPKPELAKLRYQSAHERSVPSGGPRFRRRKRGAFGAESAAGGQDSRMATTPWPPAAQMEIRPRLPGPASCSILASWATIRPPVAANGCPAASDEPLTLSFDRSIEPSGASRPSLPLQNAGSSQAFSVDEHRRGERLVDLVEVEVLQAQAVAGQHHRHRVDRRHQQALAAVHVVDGGGLRVDQVREHRQALLGGPLVGGQQHGGGAVGQRRRVARRHRRALALAEDRLELRQLLDRSSPAAGSCPGSGRGTASPGRRRSRGRRRRPCSGASGRRARPAPRGRSPTPWR